MTEFNLSRERNMLRGTLFTYLSPNIAEKIWSLIQKQDKSFIKRLKEEIKEGVIIDKLAGDDLK